MKTILTLLFCFLLSATIAQESTKANDTIYRSISVYQADSLITAYVSNPDFVIIDVRTASDFTVSHLANAINIDFYGATFDSIIQSLDHNKSYLLYCAGGSRSTHTFGHMQTWHFREVYNMLGGINAWIAAGFPVETATSIVANFQSAINILSYANPVSGSCLVNINPFYCGNLYLTDIAGNIILSVPNAREQQNIEMSACKSGMYFLRFESNSGMFTGKLIVK